LLGYRDLGQAPNEEEDAKVDTTGGKQINTKKEQEVKGTKTANEKGGD